MPAGTNACISCKKKKLLSIGSGSTAGPGTQRCVHSSQRPCSTTGENRVLRCLKYNAIKALIWTYLWLCEQRADRNEIHYGTLLVQITIPGAGKRGWLQEQRDPESKWHHQDISPSPGFIVSAWLSVAGNNCVAWNETRDEPPSSKIYICASSSSKISYTCTHTLPPTHTPQQNCPL